MRRYLQFRLKHLFLLTFIVAIACSLVTRRIAAMKTFESIVQRDGIYTIIDTHADIYHRLGLGALTDHPFMVALLDGRAGEIERADIGSLGQIDDEPLSDPELFFLIQASQSTVNQTGHCTANDATIGELAANDCSASVVILDCSGVTDRALESLQDFPELRCVSVRFHTDVTDRGIRALASCQRLNSIQCGAVTIDTLRFLVANLPRLKLISAAVIGTREDLQALEAASPGVKFDLELIESDTTDPKLAIRAPQTR